MAIRREQYPYVIQRNDVGEVAYRPLVPILLTRTTRSFSTSGLVDSGSDISVMPYSIGRELGGDMSRLKPVYGLSGNLARYEARALLVQGRVGQFESVELVFAWVETDRVRLILGRLNFFDAFNVRFFNSTRTLELSRSE